MVRLEIKFVLLNGPCEDEQARIFDGPGNSSDVIKTFCGMSSMEIYFSSSRGFFLEAKTGQSSQHVFSKWIINELIYKVNVFLDFLKCPEETFLFINNERFCKTF